MWPVIGWAALAGGAAALIMAVWMEDRSRSGPYGDVAPFTRGAGVSPEWTWTYRVFAVLWFLVCAALVTTSAHLLPDVRWLNRFRMWGNAPVVPVAPPAPSSPSMWARLAAWTHAMWESMAGHLSAWFVALAAFITAALPHWFFWDVVLCLLVATVLEVRFEFLRSSEPGLALTDRYWAHRRLYRTASVVRWATLMCVAGLSLGALANVGWNWAAPHTGWPGMTPVVRVDPFSMSGDHAYFKLALGCSALVGACLALWCRRQPLYDLFLSYKSQDAPLVREVADRLIAGGTRVWLAEYEVPLPSEVQFLRYIARGIRRSRFGLAFTHAVYANSPYCREEMEGLLRSCGPRRMLRVKLKDVDPADSAFRGMDQIPTLRTDGDVGQILTFVERRTGLKSAGPAPAQFEPATHVGKWAGRPYTLDTTGWEKAKQPPDSPVLLDLPAFHYIQGPPHLLVNLDIRKEQSEVARFRKDADDREMYNRLKAYVPEFLGELKAEARGIHMFFHGGLSQMAVTYLVDGDWRRKYSVVLPDPAGGPAVEFMFTFGFLGPFRELCRLTPVIERLVSSLEWK